MAKTTSFDAFPESFECRAFCTEVSCGQEIDRDLTLQAITMDTEQHPSENDKTIRPLPPHLRRQALALFVSCRRFHEWVALGQDLQDVALPGPEEPHVDVA